MTLKEIEISTESWSHTCGDGCCYTWGTDVFLNNEKVSSGDYDSIELVVEDLLKHLIKQCTYLKLNKK